MITISKQSNEWETPKRFFRILDRIIGYDLDPCATRENAKCKHYFTKENNGLRQEWHGCVFMNPPFSDIYSWVKKAYEELDNMDGITMLLPARVDSKWFFDFILPNLDKNTRIEFKRGRFHFSESRNSAPFACFIIQVSKGMKSSW